MTERFTTTLRQRVLGNSAWHISEKMMRAGLGLFVGVWVARYLGSRDFGLLNFSIAYVALFTFMAELGLQAIVVRELVLRPESRSTIVASALALKLLGAVAAITLATASIALFRPGDRSVLLVLVLALALVPQAWDAIDFDYQAQMRGRPVALVRSISLVAFSVVKVALILAGMNVLWFAWVVVGETALSALLLWVIYHRGGCKPRFASVSAVEMKKLLSSAWPFAIASLSVVVYMRIDQVMLGYLLGDRAVGIFSAAVRVSESWYFVPMACLTAVAPVLTAAHASSQSDYERKLVMFIRVMLGLGILATLPLVLFSHQLIDLLYSSEYSDAAPVLALHGWAGVFVCLGLAAGPWFVNADLVRFRMVHTIIGALLNIALNLVLIPKFGAVGAAFSTLVSYSLAAFWLNALSRRTRSLFRLQALSVLFWRASSLRA